MLRIEKIQKIKVYQKLTLTEKTIFFIIDEGNFTPRQTFISPGNTPILMYFTQIQHHFRHPALNIQVNIEIHDSKKFFTFFWFKGSNAKFISRITDSKLSFSSLLSS